VSHGGPERSERGKLLILRPRGAQPDALSDAALVAACAVGDRAARAALFERHADAVFRFVSRMAASDDHDCDDLVQLTFLAAYRTAGSFRGDSVVRTWLCAIASNVVKNHARGEIRRRAMLNGAGEVLRGGASLHEQVARRELVERLPEAIAALPHHLREVFVLMDLDETRGADAAAALGIPAGTLWRRLHEARAALRAALLGGGR
jgi:RNA polymerase sigma-70 factor (ECF subfamily)